MRTCLVLTLFSHGQPGFLDFSYRVQALAKRYRLTIVSNAPLEQPELQIKDAEYLVIPQGVGRVGWLRYLWDCARLIRARNPDVTVLLHSALAPVALMSGASPTVLYWNEHPTHMSPSPQGATPIKHALRKAIRGLMYAGARGANLVMPIGEAHRDELLEKGVDPGKVEMIYMGVHPMFHALTQGQPTCPEGKVRLIYTGSVMRERGRDVMLEGLAEANRNGSIATLTLVGASPDQVEYCKARAVELGIHDDLIVHGRVPGHEIPIYLRQADAGICLWEDRPYWRFNPPTKLFEYLVAGLPVLASNIRTHTQYVSDWQNGLIFEYASKGFADVICRLWQKRAELPKLKRQSLESGEKHLWNKIEPDFLMTIEKRVIQ